MSCNEQKILHEYIFFLVSKMINSFYSSSDYVLLSDAYITTVDERAVSFRLAYYLQHNLDLCRKCTNYNWSDEIVVDSEYNKHEQHGKEVYQKCKMDKNDCLGNMDKSCFIKTDNSIYKFECTPTHQLLKQFIKNIDWSANDPKTMRPDILLHSRLNNNNNYLVIEIKKRRDATAEYGEDFGKLTYLTCPQCSYRYEIGIFLELGKKSCKYLIFMNGEIIHSINPFRAAHLEPLSLSELHCDTSDTLR